jgi:hypothetical protein
MVNAVQKHLRRIRYYSASHQRTRWSNALDAALILTFLLALPVSLVLEYLVVRHAVVNAQHGRMDQQSDGGIASVLVDPDEAAAGWSAARPYGEFILYQTRLHRGWPWSTRWQDTPYQLSINIFSQPDLTAEQALANQPHIAQAVELALVRGERVDVLRAWQEGSTQRSRSWLISIVNALFVWLMLYVFAFVLISLARLMVGMYQIRTKRAAAERRRRGYCVACGYDMRGLEFHARCPECGDLVQ